MVNLSFERWQLPAAIKIDNGRPFVHPKHLDVPTWATLWWTGLGIEVIQNTPGRPQENGVVEGLQSTLNRWSNPARYDDLESFQKAVDEAGRIQREVYKVTTQNYQTRLSLFPELTQNKRIYRKENFDFTKVQQYLARKIWRRTVKQSGEIRFMGVPIYVGYRWSAQIVTLSYDPQEDLWVVHDSNGQLVKTSMKKVISEQKILDFIE